MLKSTSFWIGPLLVNKNDVFLVEDNGEKKVIRIDNVRLSESGYVLLDYSVLYPNISVCCLMNEVKFGEFKNVKRLFQLPDQEIENFLQFLRDMKKYEAMKTAAMETVKSAPLPGLGGGHRN